MKLRYNSFLIVCLWVIGMCAVYGSESKATQKNIQDLVVLKKMAKTDGVALLEQQEKMMVLLLEKQEAFEQKYIVLMGIVLVVTILFGIVFLLNIRGSKRLQKIVSLLEQNKKIGSENNTSNHDKQLNIDPEIIYTILENLKVFERERGFLNPKITLHSFAKKLRTNTKYLSRVINTYKLKSFRSYINDLRVQYSIEEMKKNVNYRNYTVDAMAKEVGFGNSESFSKAFQKNTGARVSEFLKQLS